MKQAFDYSHREIAEAMDLTIANSRKLLSRAKTKLDNYKVSNNKTYQKHIPQLKYYTEAMKNNNMANLEKLLSKDILLAADGGENIKVVRELTFGISKASKLLLYVYKAFLTGLEIKFGYVNHQPAILFYKSGILYNCQVFELEKKKIKSIYSIVDPKKLKSLFI